MSYRFMRIIVLFDLPSETPDERRSYTKFRFGLLKIGFQMLQKSVYTKIALNASHEQSIVKSVRAIQPQTGIIHILSITEKQYQRMNTISSISNSECFDSDERIIFL